MSAGEGAKGEEGVEKWSKKENNREIHRTEGEKMNWVVQNGEKEGREGKK